MFHSISCLISVANPVISAEVQLPWALPSVIMPDSIFRNAELPVIIGLSRSRKKFSNA